MTAIGRNLAEWLGRYGLDQYATLFEQNNVDESVLPDLTESDLEKLGISLGHRKKLLKAIASLAPEPTVEIRVDRSNQTPVQQRDPELRHITVVFCDLVGATQLAERLDPEDLQTLTEVYRKTCSAAVSRYGGHVARYFGDGVMAFFGW